MAQGPLDGVKVVEFAGIGPAPFAGMLLSDLGADVVRIDRKGQGAGPTDITSRGRRSVALDLKHPEALETCLRLIAGADALIEGFRPGVMERLGLGPEPCLARAPKLVYGRMTGWGQTGPYAMAAGHDINYLALTGALHAIGTAEKPIPPLNLVADFGGGAMYLAFGLLAGVLHARAAGQGQVIDVAMTDGAASLMAMTYGMKARNFWTDDRRSNYLDGGAPFYDTYQCSDGGWMAVGPLEPQFYAEFVRRLGAPEMAVPDYANPARWPELLARFTALFATKTRAEWTEILAGCDACAAPVLTMDEAPHHPHNTARETFLTLDGVVQPAPAPRFSATPGAVQRPPAPAGRHNDEALSDWGFSKDEIAALTSAGAL
jgi:alpha-methylacyl-CoA racemase